MKDKFISISIFMIIFSSMAAIFVMGELAMEKFSQGYTFVHFENTDKNNFDIVITNSEKDTIQYELKYFINDKERANIKKSIPYGQSTITPPEKIVSAANEMSSGKITVEIRWDDKHLNIRKPLTK